MEILLIAGEMPLPWAETTFAPKILTISANLLAVTVSSKEMRTCFASTIPRLIRKEAAIL